MRAERRRKGEGKDKVREVKGELERKRGEKEGDREGGKREAKD